MKKLKNLLMILFSVLVLSLCVFSACGSDDAATEAEKDGAAGGDKPDVVEEHLTSGTFLSLQEAYDMQLFTKKELMCTAIISATSWWSARRAKSRCF